MDAFKYNAKNKELANSLMGGVPDEKRIHRTFGGFISGAGSMALPMVGEMMGGPLGGLAGGVLGMASQHVGDQLDGKSSGKGRDPDNVRGMIKPRRGTYNEQATQMGNQILNLERQTGAQAHEYEGPAASTFDDSYTSHQQNEIDRLQTIAKNNEMRQELESLRNQLGVRPDDY
jgi:hypothetical protein